MSAEDARALWRRRLAELRRLKGWSQRRLAREFRVSPGAVSQWESGQRAIPGPVRHLVELYETMDISGPGDYAGAVAPWVNGPTEDTT